MVLYRPTVLAVKHIQQMVNNEHIGQIVSDLIEAKVSFELWVDSGIGLPMLH
jgi:hypothetical protein